MKYLQCCQSARTLWAAPYRLIWIVLLFALMAMPINASSQTVHALLVIMDADPSLGNSYGSQPRKCRKPTHNDRT